MEVHWASGESRTQHLLEEKIDSLSSELNEAIEMKLSSFEHQLKDNQMEVDSAKEQLSQALEAIKRAEHGYAGSM